MNSRVMRFVIAGVVIVVAVVAIVVASGSTKKQVAALKTVTYAYDFPYPDMELIPIVVAQKEGFFKKAGLKVNIVFPPNTSTTAKMLATGSADIGFVTTTDMAAAINQNVPLLSVANFSMSNNWGLFTKPGVTTPLSALKGKKIFSWGDTWTQTMLPFVYKKAGIKASDVTIVTSSNDMPLLMNGKIDFTTSTTNYGIPGIVDATGKQPGVSLTGAAIGVPDIPIWNYAVKKQYSQQNGETIKSFLSAVLKATHYAIAHRTVAVGDFETAYPQNGYSHNYNVLAWNITVPLLVNSLGQFFTETDLQWSTLTSAMISTGQLSSAPGPRTYYTNKFQPQT